MKTEIIKTEMTGSKTLHEAINKLSPKYRRIIGEINIPNKGKGEIIEALKGGIQS